MGGSGGRFSLALVIAVALLTTALSTPTIASDGCSSAENGTAAAPSGQPSVTIEVTWEPRDDVMVEYWAVPSGGDGYPAAPAWAGGCTEDAWGVCNPLYPLIFTEPRIFGYNTEDGAGTYTLMAMVHGACVYATADGQPDGDKVAAVYARVSEVPVTATITEVAIDSTSGQHAQFSNVLPMPPDEAITDYEKWWRELGTFDWDPATGIANVQAAVPPTADKSDAQIPELSPLDPRIGLTEAGSLPGPNESSDSEASAGAAESAIPAVGATSDLEDQARISRLERALYWLARDLWNPSLGLEDDDWETGVRQGYEFLLAGIGFQVKDIEARGGDASELREAAAALNLFWRLRSGVDDTLDVPDDATSDVPPELRSSTTAPDADHPDDLVVEESGGSAFDTLEDVDSPAPSAQTVPGPAVPPGTDGPPSMGKKAQEQGRVWVSVPVEVKVNAATKKTPNTRRTLKPDTWYQLRITPDGDQVFYSKQGKYLGKRAGGKGAPVQVQVWID